MKCWIFLLMTALLFLSGCQTVVKQSKLKTYDKLKESHLFKAECLKSGVFIQGKHGTSTEGTQFTIFYLFRVDKDSKYRKDSLRLQFKDFRLDNNRSFKFKKDLVKGRYLMSVIIRGKRTRSTEFLKFTCADMKKRKK